MKMKYLPALGGSHDLELMSPGKVPAGRNAGIDDALRQVADLFVLAPRHVSRQQTIEAAILASDDDDVLDRLAVLMASTALSVSAACAELQVPPPPTLKLTRRSIVGDATLPESGSAFRPPIMSGNDSDG
jgi:hypothetical protein